MRSASRNVCRSVSLYQNSVGSHTPSMYAVAVDADVVVDMALGLPVDQVACKACS